MIKILFVCLGNICRSPLAEGHFQKLIEEYKLEEEIFCDSAGTASYHVGNLADRRTRENAETHGLKLTHRSRQFDFDDLKNFDYILAMDDSNLRNIMYLKDRLPSVNPKIFMMRHFDPLAKDEDVPDPYMGGMDGFEQVYQILKRSTFHFMEYIRKEHNL